MLLRVMHGGVVTEVKWVGVGKFWLRYPLVDVRLIVEVRMRVAIYAKRPGVGLGLMEWGACTAHLTWHGHVHVRSVGFNNLRSDCVRQGSVCGRTLQARRGRSGSIRWVRSIGGGPSRVCVHWVGVCG